MNLKTAHIFRTIVVFTIVLALIVNADARNRSGNHSYFNKKSITHPDTTRFPLQERRGDPYSHRNRNTFDFKDTGYLKRTVEYDPKTKQYYIVEKIGNKYYRTPTAFSMQEFLHLQGQKDEREYFQRRSNMLANMNRRQFKPKFKVSNDWFNRIMGVDSTGKVQIDIKPTGNIMFMAGYNGQKIFNPTLPERARNNGGFDFDMNQQLQLDAKIGNKLNLPINYNSLSNFGFENQLKLDFRGKDDDIIKQFQAGNTNFQTKGTLIPGAQSLFGVKTQLQFGKLFITTVLANQQSQRQTQNVQGGTTAQNFSIKADEYDENRHFLASQYFRNNYNTAMQKLPLVNSRIQIMRMEVWVTNRNGTTTDTRDVVGFMDLGEGNPYHASFSTGGTNNTLPENSANSLYATLTGNPNYRNSSTVQNELTSSLGLQAVQDFEKTFARKLQPTEYYFNPQIGFLSLNQQMQPDEVLGVAFQYTYNGRVFQVGEFSQDVPPDSSGNSQKILFLKLLKATSQRTNLPIWDLMMKNVYSVGYGQLERQDFKLDLTYEEPSQGQKRYLPPNDVINTYQGQPIISLANLDRLNNQNDPQPDGVFDYVEGFTVISNQSRVIFPVLEPFGHDLDYVYPSQALRNKYLFYPLYDTIKAIAQTFANLNRYRLVGRSKSSGSQYGANGNQQGGGFGQSSGEYQLGFNIPRGSVTVTANGQVLQENIDYEINYDLGTLRVTNQAVLNSGIPVSINYENNSTFGFQQKNFLGLRLDYQVNKKLALGGTVVQLGERPFFIKQAYGEDPIKNRMYGVDVDYRSDVPRLTKWLDKLPFYTTKAMSSITTTAEAAYLDPGHAKQVNGVSPLDGKTVEKGGQVLVDDFEGTRAGIDLRFPLISWTLSSIPQNNGLFPEAAFNNDLQSGYNRSKLAWYNIETVLQEKGNPNNPLKGNLAELSKPETRQVLRKEIFPLVSTNFGEGLLTTFDLAFYPKDKGPYNFEYRNTRVDANGKLRNPRQAWGGLMRNIDQTDFETSNVEFIEFWLQDPFINNTANPNGGQLYFNLGNISEDILRDGKRQYENGLRTPTNNARMDMGSNWGQVPSIPLQVTNAFSANEADRSFQDVGYDGLEDTAEVRKFQPYINNLATTHGTGSLIYQRAQQDPSGDNFKAYRDESFDQGTPAGILERYKNINNPHGNSPVAGTDTRFVNAFTQYPDAEELNRDNTMNESEEYFQYKVDIKPNMPVGSNFITDKRVVNVNLANNSSRPETWYLFRIPVSEYQQKIGNIPDFKSIRFIRMFVTGFDDSVVMRFGKLELVRNQWRKFKNKIDTTGNYINLPQPDFVSVNTLAVNIEENDQRQPIPYRMPPGLQRQQLVSNNNIPLFVNEQSVSMQVCGLPQSETRGIFKTLNMDMTQYGRLRMFIHAESVPGNTQLNDGDIKAVIRIGNDFAGNYYEVKIPLKITPPGTTDSARIWPQDNYLDFDLEELIRLKTLRNKQGLSPSQYFSQTNNDGRTYAIIGNPSLAEVRGMLMGVENVNLETVCTELWFNELRLSNLNEKGGWAAIARTDIKLADLGTITLSGTARSVGFGTLEQRVNERSREDKFTFDATANIEAGKLLPKKLGLQIPVYMGISKSISNPLYDPYDLDIKLKDKLNNAANKQLKDSMRNDAQDVTTIKTINFTNVRKLKTNGKKPMPWSLSNFDLNYSYIQTLTHNPLIEREELRRTRGGLGYSYAPQIKAFEPFKKWKAKSPWLALIKDLNVTPLPSTISIKADVFRQFGAVRPRNIGGGPYKIPETYNKYFTFDRYYVIQWPLTRSINIDYSATNFARIDEGVGRIDTKDKKQQIKDNLLKGGRNTKFMQELTVSYNVPTAKIPLLDWTSVRINYNTKYNWLASSLLPEARALGNTLSNTQTRTVNGEFKFEELYNKWRFLRAVNTSTPPNTNKGNKNNAEDDKSKTSNKKRANKNKGANVVNNELPAVKGADQSRFQYDTIRNKAGKIIKIKKRKIKKVKQPKQQKPLPQVGSVPKFFVRMITALKRVGIQYTEDMGTTLPGYMDSTKTLGQNLKSREPGFGYIFGYQPDTNWINKLAMRSLLSADPLVSALIQQRYNQRINLTAQVSPFRDFNIDFNLDKTFDKNYSELYKDTLGGATPNFARLNPYAQGSFSVSYIAFQTMFKKFDPTVVSETFKVFENNRLILSQRLKGMNQYASSNTTGADGYVQGYGRYAQDVVIPAFLAAYTNKDPGSVQLIKNNNPNLRANPFSGIIPKPNWTLTYNGLSRLKGMEKIFTNFTLRHGYHSTFNMNSFNTALLFADPLKIGFPSFVEAQTGNYIPFFLVPNITIQEAFDPLIAVDMTFTNDLTTGFEFKKSRQLSLSLIDYQLAENQSTEFTFNFNWRRKGMPLIKKLPFMKGKLDNDVTFKMDFSYRDDATANSKLDQGTSFGTAGQTVISIKPSINYIVNNRVSMEFFFDQTKNKPKIPNTYPITRTQAGVRVRVSLSQ
ncbi:MAG: cell surface protein SprA [Bacteroidota bacterium]